MSKKPVLLAILDGYGKSELTEGNAIYTATYNKTYINYTIKFVNDNGSVLSEKTD